ncbi:hypothetical protein ACXDTG_004875 [Klebsiella pneumoniae]
MSKAKIALAAGMLLGLTTLSTHAAQTKAYANTSVTGSFTIGADCALTAKLRNGNPTFNNLGAQYRSGAILDTLIVTPTCSSKVWVQGNELNEKNQLVAKSSDGTVIPLGLGANSNAWDWKGDLKLLTTKKPVNANTSETLNVALANVLPPYNDAQGKTYTYTLKAGYWVD